MDQHVSATHDGTDAAEKPVAKPQRFRSLDVFRGASVALMILVNNPGTWSAMYPPLQHAEWHGCTPTDLVFPFFLFAVGNALAFVFMRMENASTIEVAQRIALRTFLIFAIGFLLNLFPFVRWDDAGELAFKSLEHCRIFGVLQRIALSFGGAATLVWLLGRDGKTRGVLIATAILLVGYWIACIMLGDATDPYSLEGFIGTKLDRALLGESHLYHGEGVPFDPEGLFSTIPGIAQVMIGWVVGQMMLRSEKNLALVGRLMLVGVHLLLIAYLWQLTFPLNKKIWTSSFVLHTCGLATLVLASINYWMEVPAGESPNFPRISSAARSLLGGLFRFFEVFGKNPLFIFVFSAVVVKLLALFRWHPEGSDRWTSPLPWLYGNFFRWDDVDPRLGSFLFSVCLLAVYWLIVALMDRRKIYIRV
ncbi:heparan-alpha-glucosaminide N-acetyltransferase domain-containing protein [Blastopirellula sp. JC732]|uniref:Heparan-alpha-glucosaminide N-acetyltransferase domain-containing protein n=1 Tax=Blastopirellula sediminis TaxID=2894196 RepID=A0A9X1MJ77_9BACT|nr:DUF5009 domain-containing protein [Blastopirellula sediminis]MCC9604412.1 heparan-alpha-glucosaminide N-acetyltransferase domain-containing protein [Blastopirellula sediminis]MCC9626932.1 heparan-alpha-glucosaminide N-acetyltransferase domain-containing protein [Blastopirellula sediminis]